MQHLKPVVIGGGKAQIGTFEHLQRRRDVEHGEGVYQITMIFGEAMRNAAAAIMPHEVKPIMAQLLHHLDHVLRHRALGIVRVIGQAFGLGGSAIAPQVSADHGVVFRQLGGNLVPARHGLWIPVQQ